MRLIAQTALGPVQALNLHPPVSPSGSRVSGSFTTGRVRLDEIPAFAKDLDEGLPTLWVGDFNEEADGDAICWLTDRGAHNAVSEHLESQPTWRWPVESMTQRFQLDHVLCKGALRTVGVQVLQRGNSDHLPIVAESVAG
ncbi:MAG: endonuclease/exonuclease/phosphatase family protein [Deltaproteobacteria bacterium]|nr:endonuclease/exonuclease/phosphatase family protein [Deltaproteobacteria bacterium]